jgi:Phosphoesterase family
VRDDNLTGPGTCGVTAAGGTPGRWGYGPRLPLIVISPHAKHNYVDHRLADQASILRFIEDNWNRGRIGGGFFEKKAGTLNDFFDFSQPATNHRLILDRRLNLQIASMALSFARGHEFGAQANRKMHRGAVLAIAPFSGRMLRITLTKKRCFRTWKLLIRDSNHESRAWTGNVGQRNAEGHRPLLQCDVDQRSSTIKRRHAVLRSSRFTLLRSNSWGAFKLLNLLDLVCTFFFTGFATKGKCTGVYVESIVCIVAP